MCIRDRRYELSTHMYVNVGVDRHCTCSCDLRDQWGVLRDATDIVRSLLHVVYLNHTIDIYQVARNVVFHWILMRANNAISSCQLLLLFCGRFERSGVQASCRAPNSIHQTSWPSRRCSGAGGVFSSRWRCVSVVTQRKVSTPLSKKSCKLSFLNQARWSRRLLLVISTAVNNENFLNWWSVSYTHLRAPRD